MLHFALCMSMFVCLEIKIFVFVFVLPRQRRNSFQNQLYCPFYKFYYKKFSQSGPPFFFPVIRPTQFISAFASLGHTSPGSGKRPSCLDYALRLPSLGDRDRKFFLISVDLARNSMAADGKFAGRFHLFTIILKVETAHRGDNTSVRKTVICYRRKHILCGLFKAVAVLGIERSLSLSVTVTVSQTRSVGVTRHDTMSMTVSHNSDSLTQSERCSPTYQVTAI